MEMQTVVLEQDCKRDGWIEWMIYQSKWCEFKVGTFTSAGRYED